MVQRNEKGQIVKGSGALNPKGRKRRSAEVADIERFNNFFNEEKTLEILETLYRCAKRGEGWAIKLILDHKIGTPINRTEISGADGEPVGIIWDVPVPRVESD